MPSSLSGLDCTRHATGSVLNSCIISDNNKNGKLLYCSGLCSDSIVVISLFCGNFSFLISGKIYFHFVTPAAYNLNHLSAKTMQNG